MDDTKYCHRCGKIISSSAEICPGCGVGQTPVTPNAKAKEEGGKGLILAGYICGLLALLIFPPGLGLAGTVIGIVNLTKGRTGHGIAQIVISVTGGALGSIFGAATLG